LIEREWSKPKKFHVNPSIEKEGIKVINIEVAEKVPEGILENHIFLIEQNGEMRSKMAFIMNPRIRWTCLVSGSGLYNCIIGFFQGSMTELGAKEIG
jgi:hypothetical protein